MDRNFQASLKHVLKHEGGFVNHPRDPGGATNKGITIGTMRRYVNRNATVNDLKQITDAQVATIYRKHYWDKVKGDELPSGVDYAVFDFAVNSGPSRAAKFLQDIVGVTADGAIGPETLAAVNSMDASVIIERLCGNRLAWLKRLKTWPTFRRGWTVRVSNVEGDALRMAHKPADAQKSKPGHTHRPEPKPSPAPSAGRNTGIAVVIAAVIAAFYGFACDLPLIWQMFDACE